MKYPKIILTFSVFLSTSTLIGCWGNSSELGDIREMEKYRVQVNEKIRDVEQTISILRSEIAHTENVNDELVKQIEKLERIRIDLYEYLDRFYIATTDDWQHLKPEIEDTIDEFEKIHKDFAVVRNQ